MPNDLLNDFRTSDRETQQRVATAIEKAYHQGRRDQSAVMTQIAADTDQRVRQFLEHEAPNNTTY